MGAISLGRFRSLFVSVNAGVLALFLLSLFHGQDVYIPVIIYFCVVLFTFTSLLKNIGVIHGPTFSLFPGFSSPPDGFQSSCPAGMFLESISKYSVRLSNFS